MRKDDRTSELPDVPKPPGRPRTGQAMTPAQRKAAQRARQAESGLETVAVVLSKDVADSLRAYCARKVADSEPVTMGEAVEKILRDRLLRKR